jgi:hypothetical protein
MGIGKDPQRTQQHAKAATYNNGCCRCLDSIVMRPYCLRSFFVPQMSAQDFVVIRLPCEIATDTRHKQEKSEYDRIPVPGARRRTDGDKVTFLLLADEIGLFGIDRFGVGFYPLADVFEVVLMNRRSLNQLAVAVDEVVLWISGRFGDPQA